MSEPVDGAAQDDDKLKLRTERLTKRNEGLRKIVDSSVDSFEKQLSFISGGALALSFVVIEKVLKDFSKTHSKGILVAGWFFLTLTLLLNLFSHQVAIIYHSKTIKENETRIDNPKSPSNKDRVNKRFATIVNLNTACYWFLAIGLFCLITYTSINLVSPVATDEEKKNSNDVKVATINNYYLDTVKIKCTSRPILSKRKDNKVNFSISNSSNFSVNINHCCDSIKSNKDTN